jgi:hypothetical protein
VAGLGAVSLLRLLAIAAVALWLLSVSLLRLTVSLLRLLAIAAIALWLLSVSVGWGWLGMSVSLLRLTVSLLRLLAIAAIALWLLSVSLLGLLAVSLLGLLAVTVARLGMAKAAISLRLLRLAVSTGTTRWSEWVGAVIGGIGRVVGGVRGHSRRAQVELVECIEVGLGFLWRRSHFLGRGAKPSESSRGRVGGGRAKAVGEALGGGGSKTSKSRRGGGWGSEAVEHVSSRSRGVVSRGGSCTKSIESRRSSRS